MRKFLSSLLVLISFAYAEVNPKSSKFDNRITFITYNADDVVNIKAKNGYVTTLKFAKDERIINIAIGFPAGWEVVDRENFLFIKPKAYVVNQEEQSMTDENGEKVEFQGSSVIQPNSKDWNTNLTITSNKRIYFFDLILVEGESKNINYGINFSYPEEKIKAKKLLFKEREERNKELKILENKKNIQTKLNETNIPKNWEFYMHINKGSKSIAPDFTYDDGIFTYIGFSKIKTIPSVFILDDLNNESITNHHLKNYGDFNVLVVHSLSKRFLLRSGSKLVGILNGGYGKNPQINNNSTINQSVIRKVINE